MNLTQLPVWGKMWNMSTKVECIFSQSDCVYILLQMQPVFINLSMTTSTWPGQTHVAQIVRRFSLPLSLGKQDTFAEAILYNSFVLGQETCTMADSLLFHCNDISLPYSPALNSVNRTYVSFLSFFSKLSGCCWCFIRPHHTSRQYTNIINSCINLVL